VLYRARFDTLSLSHLLFPNYARLVGQNPSVLLRRGPVIRAARTGPHAGISTVQLAVSGRWRAPTWRVQSGKARPAFRLAVA